MPTEDEVYRQHAEQYERLIQREDYHHHILRAVEQICPLKGLDVIDLGAGTGRLTRLLAPHVGNIKAYDASAHMLSKAQASLHAMSVTNWQVAVADHRQVPVPDASADLVISGWSFCYLAVWGGESWRDELENGYREIQRLLRPGGFVILLETLGTGQESPNPPANLAGYYAWLTEKGFQSTWIRTDYRFDSLTEAVELSKFFFGEKLGRATAKNKWLILPECTGVWWQQKTNA
jgi:ubiquinone/menaquinone biosynthesis C-methylase UbiE